MKRSLVFSLKAGLAALIGVAFAGTAQAGLEGVGEDFKAIDDAFLKADYEGVLARAGAGCEAGRCPDRDSAFLAGLSAWRLGDFALARAWFEGSEPIRNGRVDPTADEQRYARGAYWAARADLAAGLQAGDAGAAARYLDRRSEVAHFTPVTLYGRLAEAKLGLPLRAPAPPPRLSEPEMIAIAGLHPKLAEARAEAIVGDIAGGDEAVIAALKDIERARYPQVIAFAHTLGLSRAAYAAAARTGDRLAPGRFPTAIPAPADGWRVDRATLLALAHQESRFNPRARSVSDARGLTQLLPSTAAWIAKDDGLKKNPDRLYDPALNMSVGQLYFEYVLQTAPAPGDLLLAYGAYNAGPGRVKRWFEALPATDDPLLALESLPTAQSRDYVRRVLANLWTYRAVLGQPSPELVAMAQGSAPIYRPLDGRFAQAE